MTERVRTAEVKPPLTEIETGTDLAPTETGPNPPQIGTGTGNVQTLLATVVVLGTMGDTQRSPMANLTFGTFVSVTSSGIQPQVIIGTTSGALSRTGCDAVTCMSCRASCRGTIAFSRTTGEWSKGKRTSTLSILWHS